MSGNRRWVAIIALAIAVPSLRAQELPADLAAVPSDALGYLRVRVAELWKQDALKDVRAIIAKAGPEYLRMFDKRFLPAPSSIDRLTIAVWAGKQGPVPLAVISLNEPLDRDRFVRESLKSPRAEKINGAVYHAIRELGVAVHVASDRLLIVADEEDLKAYLSRATRNPGPLTPALSSAANEKAFNLVLRTEAFPRELLQEVPGQVLPLLKSGIVHLSIDVKASATVELRIDYANGEIADSAQRAYKESLGMIREMLGGYRKEAEQKLFAPNTGQRTAFEDLPEATAALAALGFIARVEELIADHPVNRTGNSLAAAIKVPEGPFATAISAVSLGAGMLLPAVQKVREAAARTASSNNLKQIVLAMHNYATAFDSFPPAAICDKKGKPLLSWRVAILPYIEQDNLYRQFKLDEPWDSEHNLKLAHVVVKVYTLPTANLVPGKPAETHYQAFVGNGAALDLKSGTKITSFLDGTSNTVLVAEAEKSVPWTKPDDFSYDPRKPPAIGYHWNRGSISIVAFADGSVRAISNRVPESTWHLLIQRNDGQVIPNFDK